MNLSSPPYQRWVIDRMGRTAVRYAKALAAEHNVRIAEVVEAALLDLWEDVNNGSDDGQYWHAITHGR